MAKNEQLVRGRWRIVETEIWDREALDLVVPAHITFGRNGLGEMELIAIGASIDYRVEASGSATVIEFSWSGFDEMDSCSGRARATIESATMRGTLFIHQGDESSFVAKREQSGSEVSRANKPPPPSAALRARDVRTQRTGRRSRS